MTARMTLAIGLAILAAGCSMIPHKAKPPATGLVRLEQQKTVFVALPDDANAAGASYLGSGQAVAQIIAGAFAKRGVAVHVAEGRSAAVDAVETAARLNAGYVVLPTITRWEYRSERFGHPDRATIRVTVIDVISGDTVASRIVDGRPRTLSLASHTPDTLLEDPLQRFVNGLYRF